MNTHISVEKMRPSPLRNVQTAAEIAEESNPLEKARKLVQAGKEMFERIFYQDCHGNKRRRVVSET